MIAYHDYLRSDAWKVVARTVKEHAGFRCQVCNSPDDLVAHHRSYAHLGDEMNHLGDLTCLCRPCHERYHDPKEVNGRMVCMRMPVKSMAVKSAHNHRCRTAKVKRKHLQFSEEELNAMYEVTDSNHTQLYAYKDTLNTLSDNGINYGKKGWMRRAIGKYLPLYCFQPRHRIFISKNERPKREPAG